MSFTLWERDDVEKNVVIVSREDAQRILAQISANAREAFRDRSAEEALLAYLRAQPATGETWRRARAYLVNNEPAAEQQEEGTQMKSMPSVESISKKLRSADTEQAARNTIGDLMDEALAPVVALLKHDGLDDVAAQLASYRVCPGAYSARRLAEDSFAQGRVDAEWIAARLAKVRKVAERLASASGVSKSGAGTLESRLLTVASRMDWED